jgi:hypothetical protein
MRCARIPAPRSNRRPHSSQNGGIKSCSRQYAARFGTLHTENGNPRSRGLESATSISSRNCSAVTIGMRPRGFDGCSNGANPFRLKWATQWYAVVTSQPTRCATAGTLAPSRAAATIWYRRWSRAGNFKSRSLLRRTRCSARVSGRSRTLDWIPRRLLAMPPLLEGSIARNVGGIQLEQH